MQDALGPLPKVLELKIAQDWRKLRVLGNDYRLG